MSWTACSSSRRWRRSWHIIVFFVVSLLMRYWTMTSCLLNGVLGKRMLSKLTDWVPECPMPTRSFGVAQVGSPPILDCLHPNYRQHITLRGPAWPCSVCTRSALHRGGAVRRTLLGCDWESAQLAPAASPLASAIFADTASRQILLAKHGWTHSVWQ